MYQYIRKSKSLLSKYIHILDARHCSKTALKSSWTDPFEFLFDHQTWIKAFLLLHAIIHVQVQIKVIHPRYCKNWPYLLAAKVLINDFNLHCCMKCPQILREKTSSQKSHGIALRIQWHFFIKIRWHQEIYFAGNTCRI